MNVMQKCIRKLYSMAYAAKKDNRGSSIVIVIIAMGMVGILATTILWTSFMSYKIKLSDIDNKKSFYTAEVVMEQILAGVQTESSKAVADAYKSVLTRWDELENESNRFNVFATTYLDEMQKVYETSPASGAYDRAVLEGYVDSAAFAKVNVLEWNAATRPAILQKVDNSLVLKNIYVAYDDTANDRVSIVSTDIKIEVPQLSFRQAGDFNYDYVLIGNQGVEFTGTGTVETAGSIYAGVDATNKGGLTIGTRTQPVVVKMNEAKSVISKGDINVVGSGSSMIVRDIPNDVSNIYCMNLKLDSSLISFDGKTHVQNDLLLNGSGSKVTLTKEYFGYGTSMNNGIDPTDPNDVVKPDESSAIIINGKSSTVDLTGLSRLVLAGRSYVGQNVDALGTNTGKQVMMGESIAVKGGQIAYLVPAECIGLAKNDIVIGQNPITKVQAENIVNKVYENKYKDDQGNTYFQEIDFTKKLTKLGGKALTDFGVGDMNHIRKIHTQYKGSELVYYYVVLDSNNATDYFRQFYNVNANKKSIDAYFNKYASGGIMLGDFDAGTTEYTILGNSLVSDALATNGVTVVSKKKPGEVNTPPSTTGDYEETSDNIDKEDNFRTESEVLSIAQQIKNDYTALTTNLTTDISTPGPGTDVFSNFVKETDLTTYLSANGGTVNFVKDGKTLAVFTSADVTSIPADAKLVVTLGNAKISSSFNGLVIAKGKITVNSSSAANVKYDKTGLFKALNAANAADNKTAIEFFVNSGTSANNPISVTVDDTGNALIDYSEIVRYENWIKK